MFASIASLLLREAVMLALKSRSDHSVRGCVVAGFFLALLLISLGSAQDEPARAGALHGPVWAITWSRPPEDVHHMGHAARLDEQANPRRLARRMRERPAGFAALLIRHWDEAIFSHPRDAVRTADGRRTGVRGVWYDAGIAHVRERMDAFFWAYREAGGRLDYLLLDYEGGRANWQLGDEAERVVERIVRDPRAEPFRRELERHGLPPDRYHEVWNWRAGSLQYVLEQDLARLLKERRPGYIVWNAVTKERVNAALNEAIAEVALEYFPEVRISNFGSAALAPEHIVPEHNGHLQFDLGHVGTHGARAFYGSMGQFRDVRLRPDGPRYGAAPFDVLRYHVNRMRATVRSSSAPVHAWISHRNHPNNILADTDYYRELIHHLVLCGADDLLYWNPAPWHDGQDPEAFRTDKDDRLVDEVIGELNERLGRERRRPVALEPMPWENELIVSAMRLGADRVLYRVTAPPNAKAVRVRPVEAGAADRGAAVERASRIELDGRAGFWHQSEAGQRVVFEPVGR